MADESTLQSPSASLPSSSSLQSPASLRSPATALCSSPVNNNNASKEIMKGSKTKGCKNNNSADNETSLLREAIKLDIEKAKSGEDKDPDRLFCLSLVQEFKELNARFAILKLFCELHESDDEYQYPMT